MCSGWRRQAGKEITYIQILLKQEEKGGTKEISIYFHLPFAEKVPELFLHESFLLLSTR